MTLIECDSGAVNFTETCDYAMWGNSLKAKPNAESPELRITLRQSEHWAA